MESSNRKPYEIVCVADQPALKEQAARWFHEKWNIPLAAYMESMEESLANRRAGRGSGMQNGGEPVPQWYVAMEGSRIIGGLGVIANDFHGRKDLTPNVCAVYTEPDRRCRGVAGCCCSMCAPI